MVDYLKLQKRRVGDRFEFDDTELTVEKYGKDFTCEDCYFKGESVCNKVPCGKNDNLSGCDIVFVENRK